MITPLFLVEGNDVLMFENVGELKRYVESPDAHLSVGYDATGAAFRLSESRNESSGLLVDIQECDISEVDGVAQPEDLRIALINFLSFVTDDVNRSMSLEEAVREFVQDVGFTR